MAARKKLFEDVRDRGYDPIPETFRIVWSTPHQATATVAGTRTKVNGVDLGG